MNSIKKDDHPDLTLGCKLSNFVTIMWGFVYKPMLKIKLFLSKNNDGKKMDSYRIVEIRGINFSEICVVN